MTTVFRAQNMAFAAREGKAIYCSEVDGKPPGSPDCTRPCKLGLNITISHTEGFAIINSVRWN